MQNTQLNLRDSQDTLSSQRPQVTSDVTQGLVRGLSDRGCAIITEFTLPNNRRADVIALHPTGEITICEVKSCKEDFLTDQKWQSYTDYCDYFYFTTPMDFPKPYLPPDEGHFYADRYGCEMTSPAPLRKLNASRRKAITLRFALQAARRLAQTTHSFAQTVL